MNSTLLGTQIYGKIPNAVVGSSYNLYIFAIAFQPFERILVKINSIRVWCTENDLCDWKLVKKFRKMLQFGEGGLI